MQKFVVIELKRGGGGLNGWEQYKCDINSFLSWGGKEANEIKCCWLRSWREERRAVCLSMTMTNHDNDFDSIFSRREENSLFVVSPIHPHRSNQKGLFRFVTHAHSQKAERSLEKKGFFLCFSSFSDSITI